MRIVLVGAGLAAQRCAETLRANGHDGPITMIGAEPHAPYDRPPLSKALLAGERPDLSLRPSTWHAEHSVDLWTGVRATRLGELLELDSGERLPYDRLLVATGARPVQLPGLSHAHTLRTLDDALALDAALTTSRHIAIVGAGLIGQEVASAARARGVAATLIDASDAPFDALMGPGGGHHLRRLHEAHGVSLRLGRRLTAASEQALRLDDGTTVEADCFLVAAGVRPDTAWTGGYTAPNVFVAGDAGGHAHWEAAARGGVAAGRAMLGLPARPEAPPLVWSDQHGIRIQRIGDTQGARPRESTPRKGAELFGIDVRTSWARRRRRPHRSSRRAARRPALHRHPPPGGRMTLSAHIDEAACLAHGDCEHVAPDVFAVTGDIAELRRPGTAAQLRAAARACPAGAILLFDDETGKEVDP